MSRKNSRKACEQKSIHPSGCVQNERERRLAGLSKPPSFSVPFVGLAYQFGVGAYFPTGNQSRLPVASRACHELNPFAIMCLVQRSVLSCHDVCVPMPRDMNPWKPFV